MFWQEKPKPASFAADDSVVDCVFKMQCKRLPADHAWALSEALLGAAPWISESPKNGIHLIHSAVSGNGWQSVNDHQAQLQLPKRTRFYLRLEQAYLPKAQQLVGQKFAVDGHSLQLQSFTVKNLLAQEVVFSRYVSTNIGDVNYKNEQEFLNHIAEQLNKSGIQVTKMLSGIEQQFASPDGPINCRSVMIADLNAEQSIRLQQQGLGEKRCRGFGIVLPHKGIAAVNALHKTAS